MKPECAILTAMDNHGYNKYGRIMLQSFDEKIRKDIPIHVYHENFTASDWLTPFSERVHFHKRETLIPDLMDFKTKYAKENGVQPERYDYNKDAIKFSNKSFSIVHGTTQGYARKVFWFDADSFCFDSPPDDFFDKMLNDGEANCYLGRIGLYTETGFIGFDTEHPAHAEFMRQWAEYYTKAKVFELKRGWTDCDVFDDLIARYKTVGVKFNNLTPGAKGADHIFINSFLGQYFDHKKGGRKRHGKSFRRDLYVDRKEPYWTSATNAG